MPVNQAPLFKLISARLAWLSQRQVVIGQNLANADTPDYRPRDLRPKEPRCRPPTTGRSPR
jgi:flagellar basal-body rod protein FlgB